MSFILLRIITPARITLLLIAAFASMNVIAGGLIPGFRGMEWGDPLSKLGPFEPTRDVATCFVRKGERLRLNELPLSEVRYCFDDGKLTIVVVNTQAPFNSVLSAVEGAYGKPSLAVKGYTTWGDLDELNGGTAALIGDKKGSTLLISSNKAAKEEKIQKIIKARKDF